MSTKPFITVGGVLAQLRVGNSELQNLHPHLPHVVIHVSDKRVTRLFPTAYIDALAGELKGTSATVPKVRHFNRTDRARQLIATAQSQLEAATAARDEHTPEQVVEILGIGRATITGWHQGGVFSVRRHGAQPSATRGRGAHRIMITAAELKRATPWHLPAG